MATKKEENTTLNTGEKTNVSTKKSTAKSTTNKETKPKAKVLPNHVEVKLKSNFSGELYFKNRVTGNEVTWKKNGEVQNLLVEDIKHIRSTQPGFFENNWLTIVGLEDAEYDNLEIFDIYKILGLDKHYQIKKFADNFSVLICLAKSQLKTELSKMTDSERTLFKDYILGLNQDQKDDLSNGIVRLIEKEFGIIINEE